MLALGHLLIQCRVFDGDRRYCRNRAQKRKIRIGVAHALFLIRKQQKSDNAAAVLEGADAGYAVACKKLALGAPH